MDGEAREELLRFAQHPFRAKADARIWPAFLYREYRAAKERLKVAKRRSRIGLATKEVVDKNERDVATTISNANAYWVEARTLLPVDKLKRSPPGVRGRHKTLIADPSYQNGAVGKIGGGSAGQKIDRSRGIAGILVRTRQLSELDLTSPQLAEQVAEFIRADRVTLKNFGFGAAVGDGRAHTNLPKSFYDDSFRITEWPDANAHVLAWKRQQQRVRHVPDRSTARITYPKLHPDQPVWAKQGSTPGKTVSKAYWEERHAARVAEDLARAERHHDDFVRFLARRDLLRALKSRGYKIRKVPKRRVYKPAVSGKWFPKIADRLCSSVTPSLAPRMSTHTQGEEERIGFLLYHNPNRRRL
ncbi:hypothetical protein HYPDE_41233 [Hyphomicrobium denitrificans 1NES1]|uniref:Uncharacterized protein n=1 Tax=Hyphomicrobium denitrificans 1NES1 TaxID=670307 RepID=N0BIF2_9HYPH|nr:hypothetical protein [Hyphomicrobium denitrificans]AGK59915.1 hypothetical protein HYPDE_41233 [Hyphomicrobium denitrificans 1NES1]